MYVCRLYDDDNSTRDKSKKHTLERIVAVKVRERNTKRERASESDFHFVRFNRLLRYRNCRLPIQDNPLTKRKGIAHSRAHTHTQAENVRAYENVSV